MTPATCHQCGFDAPPRSFLVVCPDSSLHTFCDSQCLRQWLRASELLFADEQRREIAELAKSVFEAGQ